jgi:hypothetical protein
MIIQIWHDNRDEMLDEFEIHLGNKKQFVYWMQKIGEVIVEKIATLFLEGYE